MCCVHQSEPGERREKRGLSTQHLSQIGFQIYTLMLNQAWGTLNRYFIRNKKFKTFVLEVFTKHTADTTDKTIQNNPLNNICPGETYLWSKLWSWHENISMRELNHTSLLFLQADNALENCELLNWVKLILDTLHQWHIYHHE